MKDSMIIKQIGVIPFIIKHGKISTLLITPKHHNNIWIFPKGNRAIKISDKKMCLREAYEEAGITGTILRHSCGKFKYQKLGNDYIVKYFPMLVDNILKTWPEDEERQRVIVSLAQAEKMLISKRMIKLMQRSVKKIESIPKFI